MASDLENKQFLDNEIRPFIKDKLPAILETIKALNEGYMNLRKRIAALETDICLYYEEKIKADANPEKVKAPKVEEAAPNEPAKPKQKAAPEKSKAPKVAAKG